MWQRTRTCKARKKKLKGLKEVPPEDEGKAVAGMENTSEGKAAGKKRKYTDHTK